MQIDLADMIPIAAEGGYVTGSFTEQLKVLIVLALVYYAFNEMEVKWNGEELTDAQRNSFDNMLSDLMVYFMNLP